MSSRIEQFLVSQLYFGSDAVETTIPRGMDNSFKVDLDGIKKSTTSLDDEQPFIGLPTLRPNVVIR